MLRPRLQLDDAPVSIGTLQLQCGARSPHAKSTLSDAELARHGDDALPSNRWCPLQEVSAFAAWEPQIQVEDDLLESALNAAGRPAIGYRRWSTWLFQSTRVIRFRVLHVLFGERDSIPFAASWAHWE